MKLFGLFVLIQIALFGSETRGQPPAPISFEQEREAWERAFWEVKRRANSLSDDKVEELVRDFFDSTHLLRFPDPEWGPFGRKTFSAYPGWTARYLFTTAGLQARVPGEQFEPEWLRVWPLDHEERLERLRKLREKQRLYD